MVLVQNYSIFSKVPNPSDDLPVNQLRDFVNTIASFRPKKSFPFLRFLLSLRYETEDIICLPR